MKLHIILHSKPWTGWPKPDSLGLEKLRARLNEIFAAYQPRRLSEDAASYDYLKHELTVQADDPVVEDLLGVFDKEIKSSGLAAVARVQSLLSADEVKRARFLHLYVYGDSVDEDSNCRPLNPILHVLCAACKFPDTAKISKPFLVNKTVLKKQDVFRVSTGMLVVRPRVLALLEHAIKDQIEFGEVVVVQAKKKVFSDEKLFWIRPKEMVGNELGKRFPKNCAVCKRPLESRVGIFDCIESSGPGLFDQRSKLENFGSGKADLALIDGYYGEIQKDGLPRWHWNIAISGALFNFLKKNGVKGFAASAGSDPVECFASAKGDPILEPVARAFDLPSTIAKVEEDAATKSKQEQMLLASASRFPWDFDETGHAYFSLTTPEIVVLDPMTWEEDAGGPYHLRKFSEAGVYRVNVSAIKSATGTKRGVSVDSATLLIIDNAYLANLQEAYDWEKAMKPDGTLDIGYHDQISKEIGCRFTVCTTPPSQFKSAFQGDGFYRIETKGVSRVL